MKELKAEDFIGQAGRAEADDPQGIDYRVAIAVDLPFVDRSRARELGMGQEAEGAESPGFWQVRQFRLDRRVVGAAARGVYSPIDRTGA